MGRRIFQLITIFALLAVVFVLKSSGEKLTCKNYSTRKGLANNGVYNGVEDREGCLWLATSSALSCYNPALEAICAIAQPVYITSFRIFGRETQLKNGVHLPASQPSVSFEYIGISYKDETQVRYQYRFDGLDNYWSELTDRMYVNYNNISPGKYSFEGRARNVNGGRSHQLASFSFNIAIHLWQRWWFISLVIVILGGIIISAYRYHLNKRLEIEKLRSNIATDLHDEIATSLSAIALISEMLQHEIRQVAPKLADKLKDISETARRLEESIHDIVWAIRPGNDTLEDIVLCMKQFAAEMLEARGIECSFIAPGPMKQLRLSINLRHQLYLIFKEAITNLVRYSVANHADISLGLTNEMLILSIRDNGIGFDQLKPTNGNGLNNMKKRAQAMNGTLLIDSAPAKGTTIALRMPV